MATVDAAAAVGRWTSDSAVPDVSIRAGLDIEKSIDTADLLMLCTSAATGIVNLAARPAGSLTTSISTNADMAYEVEPISLANADCYADYAPATLNVAYDFQAARSAAGVWDDTDLRSDLPRLLARVGDPPSGERPVYFRSVGLGLEDLAAARVVLAAQRKQVADRIPEGMKPER